jgi:DNA-binding response OmpR family regulator
MRELQSDSARMQIRHFSLDPVAYTTMLPGGRTIRLTALEFRVLYELVSHTGRVRTSQEILQAVWGGSAMKGTATNTVAVHIRRLRHKIESDPTDPKRIITIRNKGYMFQP